MSSGSTNGWTVNGPTNLNGAVNVNNVPLATVATTASYTNLVDRPTIPAAQVSSDWNSTSAPSNILNKPTNVSQFTNDANYYVNGTTLHINTTYTISNPNVSIYGSSNSNLCSLGMSSVPGTFCNTANTGDCTLQMNNGRLLLCATNGGAANAVCNTNGTVSFPQAIVPLTAWTNCTYLNSWSTFSNQQPAQYMKDSNGFVHLRGTVYGGSSGSTMFTLPAGFRTQQPINLLVNSNQTACAFNSNGSGSWSAVYAGSTWVDITNTFWADA